MTTPSATNYRAIVRFSLNGDKSSSVRNGVITKLEAAGFVNAHSTGSWETAGASLPTIQALVCQVMEEISIITEDTEHPMTLDHVWIYIDRV